MIREWHVTKSSTLPDADQYPNRKEWSLIAPGGLCFSSYEKLDEALDAMTKEKAEAEMTEGIEDEFQDFVFRMADDYDTTVDKVREIIQSSLGY